MRTALLLVLLVGACGDDEYIPDAAPRPIDAAVDAPPVVDGPAGPACTNGGAATVMVDLGGNAQPTTYPHAWFNHGHGTKACFEINVVVSTEPELERNYLADPHAVEVEFLAAPVMGSNVVQLHLHTPDMFVNGTATLTTLEAESVAGTVQATMGAISISGTFAAPRCDGIIDPCI